MQESVSPGRILICSFNLEYFLCPNSWWRMQHKQHQKSAGEIYQTPAPANRRQGFSTPRILNPPGENLSEFQC
jgi:hypothetical protein